MVPSPLRTRAQASAVGQFLLRFTAARFLTVDAAFDAAGFGLGTVGSPIKRGMKKIQARHSFWAQEDSEGCQDFARRQFHHLACLRIRKRVEVVHVHFVRRRGAMRHVLVGDEAAVLQLSPHSRALLCLPEQTTCRVETNAIMSGKEMEKVGSRRWRRQRRGPARQALGASGGKVTSAGRPRGPGDCVRPQ